jgi:hypothetical protein
MPRTWAQRWCGKVTLAGCWLVLYAGIACRDAGAKPDCPTVHSGPALKYGASMVGRSDRTQVRLTEGRARFPAAAPHRPHGWDLSLSVRTTCIAPCFSAGKRALLRFAPASCRRRPTHRIIKGFSGRGAVHYAPKTHADDSIYSIYFHTVSQAIARLSCSDSASVAALSAC